MTGSCFSDLLRNDIALSVRVGRRLPTRPVWALVAIVILALLRLAGIEFPAPPVTQSPSDVPAPTESQRPESQPPVQQPPTTVPTGTTAEVTAGEWLRVRRAVDGDTLLMENGVRIRLIGVDTPETKHPDRPPEPFGAEASEFTRQRVEGRNVRLEYDRERYDDHRRTLAYVFIDDQMLNEELLRGGYGRALLRFPYRNDRKQLFREAEREARDARRGIWSLPPRPQSMPASQSPAQPMLNTP